MYFFSKLKSHYFTQICLLILMIIILAGIFAPYLVSYDPTLTNIAEKYLPPSSEHYLGTDHLGRDIFSRLIWGVRTSVFYGIAAMLLTLLLGLIVGCAAALGKKRTENVLMRLCDMMLSFPSEVMIFALVGIWGSGIEHILLAIVLVKWAWYARMIYGVAQQYMHKDYVQFSQTLGATKWHLLKTHLLPVMLAELIILGTADIGGVLLMISALSFLGLGVQPPTPEWGVMLSDAKNAMLFYPEQMLPAGLAIVLTVMAFNGVGDFLRDWLDPDYRGNDLTATVLDMCSIQSKTSDITEPVTHESTRLSVENLSVIHCQTGYKLLDNIQFTLKNHRTLAIIGESGGGKSTLANALLGIVSPGFQLQGKIMLSGEIIQYFAPLRGKQIGLILQNAMTAFNPLQRIEAQWRETLQWHKIASHSVATLLMKDYAKKMAIDPLLLSCYPSQLSGGQLQRLMLAFTLSLKPKLIIADEPTSALDNFTQNQLLPLFQEIPKEDCSLIFITHDIMLATTLADEIMVLKEGKIIEWQETKNLLNAPQQEYTRHLLAMSEHLTTLSQQIIRE